MKTNEMFESAKQKYETTGCFEIYDNYVKAIIVPPLSSVGKVFAANSFLCASYLPGSIEAIGRYGWCDKFAQIAISIPTDQPDGTYNIGEKGVAATVQDNFDFLAFATKGTVTFELDTVQNVLQVTFEFEFKVKGTTYQVMDGVMSLLATGRFLS